MLRLGMIAVAALTGVVSSVDGADFSAPLEREIVVFEEPQCAACEAARREVIRPFLALRTASAALSIVDHERLGTAGHALGAPIVKAPTVVFLEDGIERARIEGYVDPALFQHLLAQLVPVATAR
ncbi:MAG: hypothetical protein GC150_17735 [Rhizobiales bacterium]|nr:hypothetical protein [Hyphomicrobiales bacterium]